MTNGFILFYVKDNQVLPVAMNQEKLDLLQSVIPVVFKGEIPQIVNKPMGEVENLYEPRL